MSFSTPAMTGTSEFRDPRTDRPFVSPSFNLPTTDSPWKLKVPAACAPQTSPSPWHYGAPSACSPWQYGAPSACMPAAMALQSPHAFANPWSEIIPTTSGLAPVDIQVLSEPEQADIGKSTNQRNTLEDGSSSRKNAPINWSSAEELAEALFPTHGTGNGIDSLSEHAEALANHKEEIEIAHSDIAKHSKTLSTHKEKIDGVRFDVKEHSKVFENHKMSIEKLRTKVNSNIAMQHQVFLDHKNKIEDLHTSSKVNETDMRKQMLQHDASLKKMRNEVDQLKLRMSGSSPDTQAKLNDLHLRTRKLETTHADKLHRLEAKLDSETKFIKSEIGRSQGSMSHQVSFSQLTAPRRQK